MPIQLTINSESDISSSTGSATMNVDNGEFSCFLVFINRNPCIMGEKLFFSVIIENNNNSSITVSSVEV